MPRLKNKLRSYIAIVLIFTLVLSVFPAYSPTAAVAKEDESIVRYMFTDAFAGQVGWKVLGNISSPPTTTEQFYGASIYATEIGMSRSFQFHVPRTGYYLISFKGYLYHSAGIADVIIDDEVIGQYDFYDPGSQYGPDLPIKTIELTEGTHTFTLLASDRNPKADQGTNYSMYPTQLTLTPQSVLPSLQLNAEPEKSRILVDETTGIKTSVFMSDGTPANHPNYRYASDNDAVATVDEAGNITGQGQGTANITITAEANGLTTEKSIEVNVANAALASVDLKLDDEPLPVGGTAKLRVTGTLGDGTDANLKGAEITYQSDDPSIVNVDEQGTLEGLKPGKTTLRATVNFVNAVKEASLPVEVVGARLENVNISLESVANAIDTENFVVSQYALAKVTGTLNNGQDADLGEATIAFTSSQPDILQIEPDTGLFKALSVGRSTISATITLEDVTKTGNIDVEVSELTSDKTRSTYYTEEKVTNARENVERYNWAESTRDAAVRSADRYVALGLDFLWQIVPPQTIPRSYGVNQQLGSPVTGKEIDQYGNYPYEGDPINDPWKIVDPSSGYIFPTNDFQSYYESGLNEHGIFDPELADDQYLVNELYPEKGPDWGVDDGYGWVDEDGNTYTFIAYYAHWFLWHNGDGFIPNALSSLRDAYIYTGDMKYARAGIVLLDRIADVYPKLDASVFDPDIFLTSSQGTGTGKALGSVWETSLVKNFIKAYDAFYPVMDDPEVIDFLKEKGEQYHLSFKDSGAGLRKNAEDGILRVVYPGVKTSKIRGNFGMHQSALALAAVVHDTLPETKEWLDFNFQTGGRLPNPWQVTGGNILTTLVNDVDRDGHGDEASPGYNRLWLNNLLETANILQGYDKYPEADLYENVKFRKMFYALYPLLLSEQYTPQIGDTGSTGNPSVLLDKSQMVKAFEVYGDPIFAKLAYFLNNNHADGIHGDIFSKNPERIESDIEQSIKTHGQLDLTSSHLAGYGFTALRDGFHDKAQYGINYMFPQLDVVDSTTNYQTYESSATVQLEATEPGHAITFAFDVAEANEYEIRLKPFRAPTYAIYDVKIDGHLVKQIDFFGASKDPETLTTMMLDEGEHTISFKYASQNAESSGYKMGVTALTLLDERAKENVDKADNTLRDVWMYYGRNKGHGHRDTLNLGMHAFGLDLAPDLGYPEFADNVDMHRHQWVKNTISHNTVVVDQGMQQRQRDGITGVPRHFDDSERVKLVDVESRRVYPQTELYKRTTAMIKVDEANSYVVDFFRVKGGTDHHFSFHSAEGTVTTENLNLVEQLTGTYAGRDVAFGERADDVAGADYEGSGFHWLKNVERDKDPADQFSIDWNVTDTWNVLQEDEDIHLRLTMLGEMDDVALADGVPPRNKPGNPESLRYFIAHRNGTNLESLFTSVIEPYKDSRYIEAIEQVTVKTAYGEDVSDSDVRAVKVTLANGRVDYIVNALDPDILYTVDDTVSFKGFFGVYSLEDGEPVYGYLNDGTVLGDVIQTETNALSGTVVDFTKDLSVDNQMTVMLDQDDVDVDHLVGAHIYVENDGVRNGNYRIEGIKSQDGNRVTFDIGDVTLVRSYADADDFSKGFMYNIEEGGAFVIPLATERVIEDEKVSVDTIRQLVERFAEDEAFKNDRAARALKMHLTAVAQFEKQEAVEKVVKHMKGFRLLLDHQKESGLISEQAHDALKANADALIKQWK